MMFTIGEFSKINKITTKTLRYYDDIGLLKPEFVDKFTGYRYYSSDQFESIHRIIELKQMGLTLNEITDVMEKKCHIESILCERISIIENNIKEEKNQLLKMKNYINNLKGEGSMNYSVVIKELPKVIVASMTTILKDYNEYFKIMPKMGKEMEAQKAVCSNPPYCFTIYLDGEYKEKDIKVQICEAVVEKRIDSENVVYKDIESVPTSACIMHKGPYNTIGSAYGYIFKWIEDNGYEAVDHPRESYIDGIWNKETPEEWLTEVQVPVKLKK
ncbi:MerR family transcriptional regulator [Clostridium sp.]|uniref:MerR family transcriptional regulator n=1 Tax=Clostridium sp. TaxID=1506 RepID=UPI0034642925